MPSLPSPPLPSGVEGKRKHNKTHEDPYKHDIVDTRLYTHGMSEFYTGFQDGIYGEGEAADTCMDKGFQNGVQDLVHVISTGKMNNAMKLMQDG